MFHFRQFYRKTAAAGAIAAGLTLAACGTGSSDSAGTAGSSDRFPITITNCGEDVSFDSAPKRVAMLKPAAVSYLHELGILDDVVTTRAGAYEKDYYDDETWQELKNIPLLTDDLDSSGHLQISKESVLAEKPDLVLGETDNLTRGSLSASDVPLIEEPTLCPDPPKEASFDDISKQLHTYAKVFGIPDKGKEAADAVESRLNKIRKKVPENEDRTAAVLYPTVGGGTTYAYGTQSIAHPQLEAAGFTDVFEDVDERVFEVTKEELIGRNPDVLILLHSEGKPGPVKDSITTMSGSESITAVKDDAIMVQLFNFTAPPTPLTVDGLERIIDEFS